MKKDNCDIGYLTIIWGSMFSGKTTTCIISSNKFLSINKKTCIINHISDIERNNSKTELISHDNLKTKSLYAAKLNEIIEDMLKYDVIIINEAQFFDDLYDIVINLIDVYNKKVIVSGLICDFKKNKFGYILDLIPHADETEQLYAYCSKCKDCTKALFSARINKNNQTQILIGNEESYIPVCRKHYNEINKL